LLQVFKRNFKMYNTNFEDNCYMLDVDEESQNKILGRTINFQGINVVLQTLVGTDPPGCIKRLIDTD
jgi:hypothetical protein